MALAPFAAFFLVVGCLIIAALLTILTLAFVKWLGGAPVIGGWIAGQATALEQRISNAIGSALSGADGLIGGSLSHLAHYADNLWTEVRGQAQTLEEIAGLLIPFSGALAGIRGLSRGLHDLFHGIEQGVKDLRKAFNGIEHRVKTLEHHVTHGIGNDVLDLERTLKKDVRHIERDLIKPLREAEAATAREVGNLYDWLKGKADIAGLGTFAAAIAAVIGAELLNLFKCPTFLNKTLKRGCGLWDGLENLLGLFFDAIILVDLCAILPEAVRFFGVIVSPLTGLISQAANSVCAASNPKWTTLNVAPGPRPDAQTFDAGSLPPDG